MDDIKALLADLAAKGIEIRLDGEKLAVRGPREAMTEEVRGAVARHKRALLSLLDARARPDGSAVEERDVIPLSAGQRAHYLMHTLHASRSNAITACTRLRGDLDPALLSAAWEQVLHRYPILMARIEEREGEPIHRVERAAQPALTIVPDPVAEPVLVERLRAIAHRRFEIDREPLVRASLHRLEGGDFCLFVAVHHIVFDGQSVGILLRGLFEAVDALASGSKAPIGGDVAQGRFAAWEQTMLASNEGARSREFWRERLAVERPIFRLLPEHAEAFDGDRPSTIHARTLDAGLAGRLKAVCGTLGVQPTAWFHAVYLALLHKHSMQDDITCLMPVMVRPDASYRDEIGFYFNVVPIRATVDGAESTAALSRRLQMVIMDAVYHSAFPFPLMVDRTRPDASVPFGLYFGYHEFSSLSDPTFADYRQRFGMAPFDAFGQQGEGDYEWALEVFREDDTWRVTLQADPTLHPDAVVSRVLDRFMGLLQQACVDPDRTVAQLALATPIERELVVRAWNDTDAPFDDGRCIHDFFVQQTRERPSAPAVRHGGEIMDYATLGARTETLAIWLQQHGVGRDSIVALCMDRSIDMEVAILAVLRAGGAYMPMDPEYPTDRLGYMLEDSASVVVLTQADKRERMANLPQASGAKVVALDTEWADIEAKVTGWRSEGMQLQDIATAGDVAYVIFTSGSTGRPKGVLVEHRALVNRLQWMQKQYPIGPGDVVAQKTPYCFDVSVWELLWTPMMGAQLAFVQPGGHMDAHYMRRFVVSQSVTVLHFVPSMLHTFLDHAGGACPSVRYVFCSGEALDAESARRYRDTFPAAALHNLYGPTEAASDVTAYDCTNLEYSFVPIGRPIDNTQILILDAHGQPQPPGVPGELHIGGVNLARGYLKRPDLTAERFIRHPFEPSARLYRTGDLARWLDDGNIQYLGRIDHQVKVGGVRIELGEIEARLNTYPGMAASAVIPRGQTGETQLIAFYRMRESMPGDLVTVDSMDLRKHLLEVLPEYMVPAAFVSLAAIPVTSNGKVDRRALQAVEVGIDTRQAYEPPATETERGLIALWDTVFKERGFVASAATIGAHDNFFDLGGNSLLATRLIYTVRDRFGVDLPVKALFEQATIRNLASQIDALSASR